MATVGLPYREGLEAPSFFGALGDVQGRSVLDLACGDGVYTRWIRGRGAASVTGCDLSADLIARACSIEAERPLGITYTCHDVVTMPHLGLFNVVTAVHLLHFARTRSELAAMCDRVRAHLAPGGRFIAVVAASRHDPARSNLAPYGIRITHPEQLQEGDAFTVEVLTDPPLVLTNYHWRGTTYREQLTRSGFHHISWTPLAPAHPNDQGMSFWDSYLDNPHVGILTADV
ncbi:class I SAM-dependent methyltransferase [Streptomyces chartreusis]|uniref:class I SAM-dependent methyltransferase n=1 Tax=Streptomyces chartreusis TaxID=1969 RepID=UPI0037F20FEA